MAVNDIQMATLPLTPQGEKPVIVTFYKVPATPNILHYTTSGIGSLSELRADIPLTTFPFYAWDQKSDANRIMWGAAANAATSILSLVDTGVIVPAPAPVPPTASAAISTLTSETTTPISSAVAAPAPSSIGVASTTSSGSQPSTTTSINQAPKTVQKDSSSISNGAVAGVAVGCLAAGIILAGLVLCLCGRKRKSFPARDYEASSTVLMPHEKGFTVEAVPLSSGSPNASPLSGTLPLPLEDKAIIGEISKISNSVKNHVQSYYQMGRISPGLIDLDDIHALGSGQPIPAGTLSTLLGNTATREIGLRFCVAWVVCSRMLPGKDSVASLLPVEFAKCYQTVAKEHGNPSGGVLISDIWTLKLNALQINPPPSCLDGEWPRLNCCKRDTFVIRSPGLTVEMRTYKLPLSPSKTSSDHSQTHAWTTETASAIWRRS